jgi:hypothetical protein
MDAGGERVIQFMLARGADPSIRDQEYHATPADWARYHKRELLTDLLGSDNRSGRVDNQKNG